MPKRYTCVKKKLRLLTFGSVNYASTAGGYAAVRKWLNGFLLVHVTNLVLYVYPKVLPCHQLTNYKC